MHPAINTRVVVHLVAQEGHVRVRDLIGSSSERSISRLRNLAMWVAVRHAGLESWRVRDAMGKTKSSSVHHAVEWTDAAFVRDYDLASLKDRVVARVEAWEPPPPRWIYPDGSPAPTPEQPQPIKRRAAKRPAPSWPHRYGEPVAWPVVFQKTPSGKSVVRLRYPLPGRDGAIKVPSLVKPTPANVARTGRVRTARAQTTRQLP